MKTEQPLEYYEGVTDTLDFLRKNGTAPETVLVIARFAKAEIGKHRDRFNEVAERAAKALGIEVDPC